MTPINHISLISHIRANYVVYHIGINILHICNLRLKCKSKNKEIYLVKSNLDRKTTFPTPKFELDWGLNP